MRTVLEIWVLLVVFSVVSFVLGAYSIYKLDPCTLSVRDRETVTMGKASDVSVTASVGEKLQFSTTTETMTVRWVSDPVEVRKVLDEYFAQTGKLPVGLSMIIGDNCVIYAFEPEYENDRYMQILGHESLHCFRGVFHEQ